MNAVVRPAVQLALAPNLQWLAQYQQFVLCEFVPRKDHPQTASVPVGTGKADKIPLSPSTLRRSSAFDPAIWLSAVDAYRHANALNSGALPAGVLGYGVGFVLTGELGVWCLDIDSALGTDGQWRPEVRGLLGLPGVAWEYSHSGRGLHAWGRCTLPLPAHETRTDDETLAPFLEFYSRTRFIALGTGAGGEMRPAESLPAELTRLFPALSAEDATALASDISDEPNALWHGPTDDDALITIALKSRSKLATMFPAIAKASFKQLWEGDADKLAKHFPESDGYNESHADQALACHLAFWTGAHGERMLTLLMRSGLHREKFDNRPDYMHRTINKACAWAKDFYNDGKGVAPGAPVPEGAASAGISLDDFYAHLPDKTYIFVPNREIWTGAGVDEAAPSPGASIKPSEWLARARPVHQMTWAPGEAQVIANRLVASGGWIEKDGANTFNLYKPPTITPGDPSKAGPWLDLLRFIYPRDADHVIKWCAHRRQFPGVKINHGLVFGGPVGIGKDSVIEPLVFAVGPWNAKEIAPKDLLNPFNPHIKSVLLRVSEARDSGEMSRYALHEHSKTLLATPPDVLRCNEKHLREHEVFNVVGVIFTTNHKDGLYLPPDDRRHYVCWSEVESSAFAPGYWVALYRWYAAGGFAHVVAYLDAVDLSGFDPKAQPEKTPAFWMMVDAGRSPQEGDLADALEGLGNPRAVTVEQVATASMANPGFLAWLKDSRNSRAIPHKFEAAGYTPVRNPDAKADGRWKVGPRRSPIYARKELSEGDRLAAAVELCRALPNIAAVGTTGSGSSGCSG